MIKRMTGAIVLVLTLGTMLVVPAQAVDREFTGFFADVTPTSVIGDTRSTLTTARAVGETVVQATATTSDRRGVEADDRRTDPRLSAILSWGARAAPPCRRGHRPHTLR